MGKKLLKPRAKKNYFAYTGMMRCGECGCVITAEKKENRFKTFYTYYHCTHRKNGSQCRQPSVEIKALEAQFRSFLVSIAITDAMHALLTKHTKQFATEKNDVVEKQKRQLDKEIRAIGRRRDNLTHLRISEAISEEEFTSERAKIDIEQKKLQQHREKLYRYKRKVRTLRKPLFLR